MTADIIRNSSPEDKDAITRSSLPSPEEIRKQIAKARVARDRVLALGDTYARGADIFKQSGPKKFNCMSLRDWLSVARHAWVLHIPALLIAEIPTDLPIRLIDHRAGDEVLPAEELALAEAMMEKIQKLGEDRVIRFDCCMPSRISEAVNGGVPITGQHIAPRGPDGDQRIIEIEDPRLLDILDAYPQRTVPVWQRPWIPARRSEGWTAEASRGSFPNTWRVFVNGSRITGISNYFPQVTRTDDEATRQIVGRVHRMASRIIETLAAADAVPHHPMFDRGGLQTGINCTLDFLEAMNGSLLLIEGGPPHMANWGAHSCCFQGQAIDGVALTPNSITAL